MDKRCKDCKYKVYEEADVNEVWGFCSCEELIRLRGDIESQLKELAEEVNRLKEIIGE